jgi:squalene cyclase
MKIWEDLVERREEEGVRLEREGRGNVFQHFKREKITREVRYFPIQNI